MPEQKSSYEEVRRKTCLELEVRCGGMIQKRLSKKFKDPRSFNLPVSVGGFFVDETVKYPYGVVEDVLVKVDKFIFHVDFVIMDMKEDEEIPLILGRPFMKTARIIVDVDKEELVEIKFKWTWRPIIKSKKRMRLK
ncbi:uncharacterized protein [Phaseolus vulgaris]|uniref:uncharacterized protein n=1 Tax=Phaseolus vulgaris TaxID=3885 RepID=UPI0035CBBE97